MIKSAEIDEMLHAIREKLGRSQPGTEEDMNKRSVDTARKYGLTVIKKPKGGSKLKAG